MTFQVINGIGACCEPPPCDGFFTESSPESPPAVVIVDIAEVVGVHVPLTIETPEKCQNKCQVCKDRTRSCMVHIEICSMFC